METPPGFNLDHAVATWRAELARLPGLTPADLRELEAHLRDGFAELQRQHLRDDEAFLLACHRVGPSKPVAAEFAKAAPERVWAPRVFWMAFGALVVHLWQTTLGICCSMLSTTSVSSSPSPLSPLDALPISGEAFSINGIGIPEWLAWMVLALMFLVICGLPVLFAGRWLASGRLERLAHLVSTRGRVAALGAGLFLCAFGMQLLALFHFLEQTGSASNGPAGLIDVGLTIGMATTIEYNLVTSSLWPLCLIVLMIWLTPRAAKTKAFAVAA
jgi:hypothetical protein